MSEPIANPAATAPEREQAAFAPETRLVRIRTGDGLDLPGALWVPARRATSLAVDGVIMVHGSTGSVTTELLVTLARDLAGFGVPALTFSNRGHDIVWQLEERYYGHAFENVGECLADIDGALDLMQRLGCSRVVVVGHSLGGLKSVFYGVNGSRSSLAAIVSVSPPRFSPSFYEGSPWAAKYREVASRVQAANAQNPEQLIEIDFPFRPTLMSPRTYLQKYCSEQFNIVDLAPNVRVPWLYTVGTEELGGASFNHAPDDLRTAPDGPQPREVVEIPDADHFYTGVEVRLCAAIRDWLARLR